MSGEPQLGAGRKIPPCLHLCSCPALFLLSAIFQGELCVCVCVCGWYVCVCMCCLCSHVGVCLTWNLNFPSTIWEGKGRGVLEGKE